MQHTIIIFLQCTSRCNTPTLSSYYVPHDATHQHYLLTMYLNADTNHLGVIQQTLPHSRSTHRNIYYIVFTRREPPTMGKQLVNFITCDCESSAPFCVIYKAGREPTQVRVTRSLVLCVCFVHLFFSFFSIFLWPLYCLSFDLRILLP
jgi:hypothetical protein